jgi:hypothetical protein
MKPGMARGQFGVGHQILLDRCHRQAKPLLCDFSLAITVRIGDKNLATDFEFPISPLEGRLPAANSFLAFENRDRRYIGVLLARPFE